MALNPSGPISLGGPTVGESIEIELYGTAYNTISLGDAAVRTLAGVPSGPITMPGDFWGKANRVTLYFTFGDSIPNAGIDVTQIGGYVYGKTDFVIVVNPGVYLWAGDTGNFGLRLVGGNPGDTLLLINQGFIMGCGGQGGTARHIGAGGGGPALSLGMSTTIDNTYGNAYIGGGGGGGGGAFSAGDKVFPDNYNGAGGGAGGGPGGPLIASNDNAPGGGGGGPGQ
jgi:hypothetical protein